jgi:hypothetical protein
MKMIRVHFALWVVLLIGGFVLGFVPEYKKNRELQAELQDPQKAIAALRLQVQLGELRDIASLMLLEVSRQNYGLARDYSEQYYNKLKEATETVQDEALKNSLEQLTTTRDSLATPLAAANPTAVTAAQVIVSKTFEATRKPN